MFLCEATQSLPGIPHSMMSGELAVNRMLDKVDPQS
jgi:hypothetical protein